MPASRRCLASRRRAATPHHSDSQEVYDRGAVSCGQSRLPPTVCAPRSPTVHGCEHSRAVPLARVVDDTEIAHDELNRICRRGGEGVEQLARPRTAAPPTQPVGHSRIGAPGFEQTVLVLGSPNGLPLVEVCSAVLTDLMGDEIGPGPTRHRSRHRTRVDDVRHQRQPCQRRRLRFLPTFQELASELARPGSPSADAAASR